MVKEQNVNPWSVAGEVGEDGNVKPIDYNKLVDQFGTKLIDDVLLERFERVTGQKAHRFLRRQIVFSHRDLEVILDRYGVRLWGKYQAYSGKVREERAILHLYRSRAEQ